MRWCYAGPAFAFRSSYGQRVSSERAVDVARRRRAPRVGRWEAALHAAVPGYPARGRVDVVHVLRRWSDHRPEFVVDGNEAGMKLGEDIRAADAAIWRRDQVGPAVGRLRHAAPVLALEVAGQDEDEPVFREKARWYWRRRSPRFGTAGGLPSRTGATFNMTNERTRFGATRINSSQVLVAAATALRARARLPAPRCSLPEQARGVPRHDLM